MESTRVERLIEKAAQWLASSRRVIAFTGAGVSRESGIPTFREAGSGFWEQYDAQQLATVEGFLQDPGLVWNWYVHRRRMVAAVEPNRGHYALARLEQLCPELTVVPVIEFVSQSVFAAIDLAILLPTVVSSQL